MKKFVSGLMGFLFVVVVLNFGWIHAALAVVATDSTCSKNLVIESRKRVNELFGEATAKPILGCLDESSAGLTVTYGTTRFAPGLPAVVVLGPSGMNVDVMAHELAHAELSQRTSVLLRSYRIPTWFDEGLAMQLDHRENYSQAALRHQVEAGLLSKVELSKLNTASEFFQSGPKGRAHYALAKCVVRKWLEQPETELLDELAQVGWLNPIDAASDGATDGNRFLVYEDRCRI